LTNWKELTLKWPEMCWRCGYQVLLISSFTYGVAPKGMASHWPCVTDVILLPQDCAKRKLLVLNLLTGQKSGFSTRSGDSLHRFTWNLTWLTITRVHLAV